MRDLLCSDKVSFMYTMFSLSLVMAKHYVVLHVHLERHAHIALPWGWLFCVLELVSVRH